MDVQFKALMKRLEAATNNIHRVKALEEISALFDYDNTNHVLGAPVQASNLIKILAKVMMDNKQWAKAQAPGWISAVTMSIYFYMEWPIPLHQTQDLLDAVMAYLSIFESMFAVSLLVMLAAPVTSKKIKALCLQASSTDIQSTAKKFIQNVTVADETAWKTKVIQDTQFLLDLLEHPTDDTWGIFSNLSGHPDAKALLPSQVVKIASKFDSDVCLSICATLCNENDAAGLKVNSLFVENTAKALEVLLEKQHQIGTVLQLGIGSTTVPFANLSIPDANKESIGERIIPLLMKVLAITRDKPLLSQIDRNLERGKREAAKTLWNLAFLESNRTRIAENGGLDFLRTLLTTTDPVLEQNIEGILYMFSRQTPQPAQSELKQGEQQGSHVMISYSWANQPTIIRLANSLKKLGYNVWLDVDMMKGSTLEAMANAIENSAVVLICMSQKYKDSPNCRLEGEYCVNRKIDYIPLLLQNEYKPDGWLGIALGTKLYYSFSDELNWNNKVTTLAAAIGARGKGSVKVATSLLTLSPQKSVILWNEEDLLEWMKAEGIEHHYDLFVKHKLNGKRLLTLRAQANISHILRDFLQIISLGDVLEIIGALQSLTL